MTDPAFKPSMPKKKAGVGIDESPKRIDLAKPDASAAELAEQLQKVPMNLLFGKIALFTGKWILRPIFWWPVKYYFILSGKVLMGYVGTKASRKEEAQRNWDEDDRRAQQRY